MDPSEETSRLTIGESIKTLFSASRGYLLVNVANFGDGIAYFGFLTLMTLFMQHNVGLSTEWAGLSIGWYTGGVTIFMALGGGAVSDRLGVRRALTFCIVLLLAGRVLYVISPGLGGFVTGASFAWIGLFIMAAGEGIIQPALYSGIKEYTDKRTATLGYAFLYAIMNLGIAAGAWLSPLIREAWAGRVEGVDVETDPTAGIAGAFWFFIAVTVVMLLINLLFFTRRVEQRDRTVANDAVLREGRFNWREYLSNLPILDVRFLFFIFVLLPVRTLFAHQYLTMPDYVTRAFPPGVGARWEWINGLNPLVIVIFVPLIAALTLEAPGGRHDDRGDRRQRADDLPAGRRAERQLAGRLHHPLLAGRGRLVLAIPGVRRRHRSGQSGRDLHGHRHDPVVSGEDPHVVLFRHDARHLRAGRRPSASWNDVADLRRRGADLSAGLDPRAQVVDSRRAQRGRQPDRVRP